jgi:hypothetical protein
VLLKEKNKVSFVQTNLLDGERKGEWPFQWCGLVEDLESIF